VSAFVSTVEAVIVEFRVSVLPVMVEKTIWLVDILLVLIDDAVIVEFTRIVLAVNELPDIVTNPTLDAVKLFPTVKFWFTYTLGVVNWIVLPVLT
jgi:hypothetical protein